MKLAILGSSPLALEAALRFHLHGASLTWFNFHEPGVESYFQSKLLASSYVTEQGLNLLRDRGMPYTPRSTFSFSHWVDDYLKPLSDILAVEQKLRPHEVVSITKKFLAPGEEIYGKSRFTDLFRIIFQVNPQEFIKEQETTNPETFERLSKELIDSLQTNLEMYEDFDLVLDLRKSTCVKSLSVTGRALGESRIAKEHLKYGLETLILAQEINKDAQGVREIGLIGSGALAAEIVCKLTDWLGDERSRLFLVSEESYPFQKFFEEGEATSVASLKAVLTNMDNEFENEVNTFHSKLREWQELDDFVQVKIQKPVEPIPRLVFFSGHNATAIDQLIDKRRLFLTLEKPDFREGNKQPENNSLELKTIGVDRILVANQMSKPVIETHLESNEKGHFAAELSFPNISESWNKDLEKLKGIENEIFKLFSPAATH